VKERGIAFLALLWRFIKGIWSLLILGAIAGILGNAGYTYLREGKVDFKYTLTVVSWLTSNPFAVLTILVFLALTLCSYLAYFHRQRTLQKNQQAKDEALVDVAKGVRYTLEELKDRPVASPINPPPPASITPVKEETPPTSAWNIPNRRNPFFTGRENLLKDLHDRLTSTRAAALTQAISGLGGIGKTQTALEYAYRYREEYRFVLWVSAASRDSLISDFVKVATLLKLPEKDEQDQNVVVLAVKNWLASHGDWLLILDNADDLEMVAEFLPTENQGHIILTTRAQTTGKIARSLEVEKMDLEEGTLLLLRRANVLETDAPLAKAAQEDRTKAEAIVREMDGLPLALDQAGAYIEETGCGISGYLELYKKRRADLLKKKDRSSPEYPNTVATTWALSFQQVEQANPAAAEILRLCASLAPDAIAEEIITGAESHLGPILSPVAADPLAFNDAVEVLRRYSLVRRNPTEKTLTIHRRVQAVLKDGMNKKTQRKWAERAVRAVNEVFPSDVEVETWSQCERYLPHALVCATAIEQWDFAFPEATQLLNRAGNYLKDHARYKEAALLHQRILAIDMKVFGPDHPEVATDLNNLAYLYNSQGNYEQAAPLYQRALAICEKRLGPDHPNTVTVRENYTRLLSEMKQRGKGQG
jgi:tetratricopeptide (TPR) repeat protein